MKESVRKPYSSLPSQHKQDGATLVAEFERLVKEGLEEGQVHQSNQAQGSNVLAVQGLVLPKCPVDLSELVPYKPRTQGNAFFRCQNSQCGVICFENNLMEYSKAVAEKLHGSFKMAAPTCLCDMTTLLNVSKSQKNYLRPYFTCGQRNKQDRCNHFQRLTRNSQIRIYRYLTRRSSNERSEKQAFLEGQRQAVVHQGENLLALEEHVMCYNADILILRTASVADPTVEYYPKEMPTTVEIALDIEGTPLKLYFSAPVDEKTSKVQMLKDKKRLRCHFPKSEFGVFGQACIKRPPIMDFSTLPRWTSKEDLNFLMVFNEIDDEYQTALQDISAFEELQNILQCIIASFVEYPKKNTCFTIHEPCGTNENTPNFTIVVQEVYCHRQVPLAKVLFCDHSVTAFPSKGNRELATTSKYREFLKQMMANREESPMAHVSKEGQVLLKRLLYSNAKRVQQTETVNPVWIDSVLQLRFQEENTQSEVQD